MRGLDRGQLAVELGDLLLPRLPGLLLERPGDLDRPLPLLLLLVDLEQARERLQALRAVAQPREDLLGAVEEPGLQVVLAELEQRLDALLGGEVGALEQVLVHADRALVLAAAAEEAPEREVQLDRLRVDLHHLDERLDRLVGLLVQQEVQALEVGLRDARDSETRCLMSMRAASQPSPKKSGNASSHQNSNSMAMRAGGACGGAPFARRR